MKRTFIILVLTLGLLSFVTSAWATTRYVSLTGAGQYSTITAAYTAASAGDTLLIGPGNFVGSLPNIAKQLIWIGAGWDQTIINANNSSWFLTSGSSGTVLEGIRFQNGSSFYVLYFAGSSDSITIRRCIIERLPGSTSGVCLKAEDIACRLYVEDCILIHNVNSNIVELPNAATVWRNCVFATLSTTTSAILAGSATTGTTELYNCVFLNARTIFSLPTGAQPIIVINNIFYDWGTTPSFGTYPTTGSIFDYNASTSAIAAPGTNAIALGTTDPFVNYDETANYVFGTSDMHLAAGSPLIDVGHPSLTDFLDGTRSDLGIYGGPRPLLDGGIPNYPWSVNIIINPNLVGTGTPVNATATGRVGPQY